jgi:hypothetical protein
MPLSEINLAIAATQIVRQFFSGTIDGALEEIGGKIVNLFGKKLVGGCNREKAQDRECFEKEILEQLNSDSSFRNQLEKLVTSYQSQVNKVYQTGNTGVSIGVNNNAGDQFFR